MKKCTKCGTPKNKNQFYKTKYTKDGLRSECKECSKAATKKYRSKEYAKKETLLAVLKDIRKILNESLARIVSISKP